MVDGPVLLAEALDAGVPLQEVVAEPGADAALLARAAAAGVAVLEVADGVLAKALDVVQPQAVAAVARRELPTPDALVERAVADLRPVVVLVGLQDPGNAGTLVRTAEAAGASGVVLTTGSVDVTNPKCVRATAGSLFRVPVAEGAGPDALLDLLDGHGIGIWALAGGPSAGGPVPVDRPVALLVGSEAHGLAPSMLARCRGTVSIPMEGRVESLNAGVAGSVVLFDLARRRREEEAGAAPPVPSGAQEPSGGPGRPVGHNDRP